MPLTPSRRSELRAQAHKLSPIVLIGDKGLTDEVIAEIDRSLKAHELIKVRAMTDDRDAREIWMDTICEKLEAQPVQQIGKVLVIYRENFDKPREKPKAKPKSEPGPVTRKRVGRDDRDDKRRRPDDKRKRLDDKRKPMGVKRKPADDERDATRTARPRSRTPSAPPASEPRRRRPRSSR
jgi:RNA-binding protein